MIIDDDTIAKCYRQANAIIKYYCDRCNITGHIREDFRAEGLLGMSHALHRLREGITKGKGAATTYCNAYVKGYLKHYHTKLYERRKSQSWYNLNQTVDIELHAENPFLSTSSAEDEVVAKDFIGRLLPILTEKQYEAIHSKYFLGHTSTETAEALEYPRRSDIGQHLVGAFKKARRELI